MKRNYIQTNLLLIISAIFVCSIILFIIPSHMRFQSDYLEQSERNSQELLEQTALNINTYLEEVARLCISPYYSSQTMNALEKDASTPREALEKKRTIEDYLRQVMTTPRKDVLRVYILTDSIYSSLKTGHKGINDDYQNENWYKEALDSDDYIYLPAQSFSGDPSSYLVFSIAKRICSLKDNRNILGVIRVDANYSGIREVCDRISVSEGAGLFIADEQGELIYSHSDLAEDVDPHAFTSDTFSDADSSSVSSENAPSTTHTINGQTYYLCSEMIRPMGWRIISVQLRSAMLHPITATMGYNFAIAALILIAGLLLATYYIRKRLRPLYETIAVMQQIEAGDLSVRANASGAPEISYLNSSFNRMLDQIQVMIRHENALTKQVYESKYLQKKAQFDALYHQIRPHFLFNTLNSISLLIKCKRDPEAVESISQLSTLLRGMMSSNRVILLDKELKIAESYLKLQQLRHENLSYQIVVDDAVRGYQLPAMTIQPIVENAVIHGIDATTSNARILISVAKTDSFCVITVKDNGIGMDNETLGDLRSKLSLQDDTAISEEGSIGLKNILTRLKLKYGDSVAMDIQSAQELGTTVTVRLPIE